MTRPLILAGQQFLKRPLSIAKAVATLRFAAPREAAMSTATATAAVRNNDMSTWRLLIRPYYDYGQKSSLSRAIQQQQNPFRRLGQRINNTNPNTVLYAVIGVNGLVFLAWQYAVNSYRQFGDGRWLNFMTAHFMTSIDSIRHGRIHTLLTSAFSHRDSFHFGLNMLVLYSMGQAAIEALGASRFLLLYGGAGIAASLATLTYRQYIRPVLERKRLIRGPVPFGSLGASGSVMGITAFYACAFPRTTFLLFFFIPMPAFAMVLGVAGYDLYQTLTLKNEVVDSAAHLGGTAYGMAYWFLRVRPMLRAGRWRV